MGINEFLKTILEWIYGFVGNYGWAVVLFTLLVRKTGDRFLQKNKSMKPFSGLIRCGSGPTGPGRGGPAAGREWPLGCPAPD